MIALALTLAAGAVLLAGSGLLPTIVASRLGEPAPPAGSAVAARGSPGAERWVPPVVAAAMAAAAALAIGGTGLVVAGLVAVAFARRAASRHRRARQLGNAARSAVPDACRVLAAELRAGSLPADALTATASASPEPLAAVFLAGASSERLGSSAALPLERGAPACPGLPALALCWQVCSETGAALAPTLELLAATIAADIEAAALVDVELAGVRLSALVLAALPAFGLALGVALGSDPVGFLVQTAAGRWCLLAAAVLDGTGWLWVRALAVRAAR